MSTITYKNMAGEAVGDMSLPEHIFDLEPNVHVMYEAIKMYRANARQGTVFVKGRSYISGTTRKPFRQKGTGRARQGSHKVPHFRGGGIPFGPKPRDYRYTIPRKVKRLALLSALSAKVRDEELIVVENVRIDEPKTKLARQIFRNLDVDHETVLLVTDERDDDLYLGCRNLPNVWLTLAQNLSAYDVLRCKYVILTQKAVQQIEEVFGTK